MIKVFKAESQADLERIFKIREEVFVIEQKVSREDEYDEFERSSVHFIAYVDKKPSGTARWRFTPSGIKLERFAVLKNARCKGIGSELVKSVLQDVYSHPDFNDQKIYLHAQLTAIPLYSKHGFKIIGDEFEECGIKHKAMALHGLSDK